MVTRIFRVQVEIPMTSALTADYVTNTLHFAMDDGDETDIADALDDMYAQFAGVMSNLIEPSEFVYKFFDLAEPPPRVPYAMLTGRGPAAFGSNAAPTEISLCLSWRADYISGVPPGRMRNRIYVGPLSRDATGTDGRPSSGAIASVVAGGQALIDASALATWDWIVYSETAGSDFVWSQGWVDNEFDTQRRRGRAATARTTFTP